MALGPALSRSLTHVFTGSGKHTLRTPKSLRRYGDCPLERIGAQRLRSDDLQAGKSRYLYLKQKQLHQAPRSSAVPTGSGQSAMSVLAGSDRITRPKL